MVYPNAIRCYPESTQILIKKLHNRIESGKNALIQVVGQTGSGKSYSSISLSLGLYLYREGKLPDVEEFMGKCTFTTKEFLYNLKDAELKKKQIYIWEEVGVSANNRNWQSQANKIMGYLTQTFRTLQHVIFITVPCSNFIDKSVRQLLHYNIETRRVNKKNKMCMARPLEIQYNNKMDKTYYHSLSFVTREGVITVDEVAIPLAPKEFIDAYEQKKSQYTKDKIDEWIEAIESSGKTKKKALTPNQEKILELFNKGITSPTEISKKIGIPKSNVIQSFVYIKNKGYELNVKEKS